MQTARKKTPLTNSSTDRTRDYAEAVVSGEIVAGPHVRNACRRHLKDLKDGHERGLGFDHEAADRACGVFGEDLRLSEGQLDGLPFTLHPAHQIILGSIFGWKRQDAKR